MKKRWFHVLRASRRASGLVQLLRKSNDESQRRFIFSKEGCRL